MAQFIDRRLNGKHKSTVNRQRFLRRYKQQIKESVADAVNRRSITNTESGEGVAIPTRDIKEPMFQQGKGGVREQVHPGNDQFIRGDKIERPKTGQGNNGAAEGDASADGQGSDDFIFQLSRDEYLDILFEDLALPNLKKNHANKIAEWKTHRAGFKTAGVPSNIAVVRSLQQSLARRTAMTASKRRLLDELQQQLTEIQRLEPPQIIEQRHIKQQIEDLRKKIGSVPFIDTFDLRFKNYEKRPIPSSQAVMFSLMDVSGSMDQATKEIAKRFYVLLYLFLTRTYDNVEVVFIRHHTQAKEVNEHDFFYSQETGGTIVSSALKLMNEIIKARYPLNQWNIYGAQASDGDNWADDSPRCKELLANQLLPDCQYYAYIEITRRSHQTLWHEYEKLQPSFSHFAMKHIRSVDDIFPVFRELFQKEHE
ncbi:YeaH/YhbH family protein [Vibrio sp. HDW18]|uniref:YeaH/YhbH family protein n=1 Tax=Vibrio sp. HDW18 TaxID=2714948 RepID=UPI00140E040A|nr:YeaH/YhbH family protein [Vibrio sp. HDW18]QIL86261.1 YeaH/YhbH family protein [Vibrio sp. HDW18]